MAQEAARLRQEEDAMAAATLQKEKEAAAKYECNAKEASKKSNVAVVTPKDVAKTIRAEATAVVSPLSAPDLTSLLTGHVDREGGQPGVDGVATMVIAATDTGADSAATTDMDTTPPVKDPADDNVKSPKKKKSKKVKLTKKDKSSKRDSSSSSQKKSSLGTPAVVATPSAKEYKFERVFYKAGLELKGDDKYGAYVSNIGNLVANIQLVDPLAIMHAVDESGGAKPLGSKTEMSNNMTVFLAYAPVERNTKAFQ
jgi:hypothetical protein